MNILLEVKLQQLWYFNIYEWFEYDCAFIYSFILLRPKQNGTFNLSLNKIVCVKFLLTLLSVCLLRLQPLFWISQQYMQNWDLSGKPICIDKTLPSPFSNVFFRFMIKSFPFKFCYKTSMYWISVVPQLELMVTKLLMHISPTKYLR